MAKKPADTDKPAPDPHICPNDGATMLPRPLPESREMMKAMIEQGSPHHYAGNFVETVHEKQDEVGVLYVCPMCKYQTRIKDAA